MAREHAQSLLLTARGSISPATCDTPKFLGARSTGNPIAHWGLRSITFTSRSLLVQLRGRPWKNTLESLKYMQKPSVEAVLLFLESKGHHVFCYFPLG